MRRRQLHVHLSDEALQGWRFFALVHGTTVTGVAEVLGLRLGQMDNPDELSREWRRIVTKARQVDAERRSRQSD
jgi:hypothetical protein